MHKLRKGQWVPVILRVTSIGVERAAIPSGALANPRLRLPSQDVYNLYPSSSLS